MSKKGLGGGRTLFTFFRNTRHYRWLCLLLQQQKTTLVDKVGLTGISDISGRKQKTAHGNRRDRAMSLCWGRLKNRTKAKYGSDHGNRDENLRCEGAGQRGVYCAQEVTIELLLLPARTGFILDTSDSTGWVS